jgi:formylglycine-generating enzyme required for sulfatase activity
MAKGQLFVSYSHMDEEWLSRIRQFLRPLERDAELHIWSDRDIQPSSNWHAEIQSAINRADAAILLISQNFLASDYVASNELPQILASASQRGLRIFPIIVSTSFLRNSPLLKYQAINNPSQPLDTLSQPDQNRILTKLAEAIDDLLKLTAGVTEEWLQKFRSRFVAIEGGTALLGDNELKSKLHGFEEHEVTVDSFRLGRFVVTQAEWSAVRNTQPWANSGNVRLGAEIPAVFVNWNDATDFVTALNRLDHEFVYRLPSEAEWEYAARGGSKIGPGIHTKFCFGDDVNQLPLYAWFDQNASLRGENFAHQVGQLRPNQLGLYDMHGNIWEWMFDMEQGLRPLRGGGFDFSAEGASSAFRVVQKADVKTEAAGFRLVQELRA